MPGAIVSDVARRNGLSPQQLFTWRREARHHRVAPAPKAAPVFVPAVVHEAGRDGLGIVLSEHTDEDGATVFQHACRLGLEGIVSKRLSAPYRSGRSTDWLKIKNPNSPAMVRVREGEW
jgi:transposase-like protein